MVFKRKFLDEMDRLRRLGHKFAHDNPQLARFLGEEASDPDVERLLEAVAFVTAKLRMKIEDDMPELTHSILQLLWPNYLRPLPSATIVCFEPIPDAITGSEALPRGTRLISREVDGVPCQFRTTTDIALTPGRIVSVSDAHTREKSIMRVDMTFPGEFSPRQYGCDMLEFHLSGSELNAQTLYLWLACYVGEIRVECGDVTRRVPPGHIAFSGFEPEQALLPYPRNAFDGYRILQEYFTFPKRFLFFRLKDLKALWPDQPVERVRFEFHFTRPMPPDVRLRSDDLSLYCAPAVNLFEHDAEPIRLDGTVIDQPVRPAGQRPQAYEIFSIDSVEGSANPNNRDAGSKRRIYHPFESMQHEVTHANDRTSLYYRARLETSDLDGGVDHLIALVRGDEADYVGENETISLSLTCTNRDLPLALGVGDISVDTQKTPDFVTYRNLTEPTPAYRPVLDGKLHWRLISNLSLNYLSLQSADPLKAVLGAYDFAALHDIQRARATRRRLDGIGEAITTPIDRLIRGLPVRGMKTVLTMDPAGFVCEGDMYLFGTVLSHFFSLYASINSFHMLEVVNAGNQERYTWPMRIGKQPLM